MLSKERMQRIGLMRTVEDVMMRECRHRPDRLKNGTKVSKTLMRDLRTVLFLTNPTVRRNEYGTNATRDKERILWGSADLS